jgi:hypothetical protein
VDNVNIYDPRDGIVYRHLDPRPDTWSAPIVSTPATHQLPSGYANGSPRTYLGRSRRVSSAA